MKVMGVRGEVGEVWVGVADLLVSCWLSQHCSPIHWGKDTNPCAVYGNVPGTVRAETHRTGSVSSDCLLPASPRHGHKYV